MKLRYLPFILICLLSLPLTGCDLDIFLEQALILDDPATFLGERQIQVKLSGSDLEKFHELGLDPDVYIAQTLRSALPPAWEAAWSIEKDSIILDFVLPFQGLKDYGTKVHQAENSSSYIDLAGNSPGLFPSAQAPELSDMEQDIGREIFTHEGGFLQAGISGLATSYFEPLRHELRDEEGNLLFYLSLGEPGHWTKSDLHFLEVLPDLDIDTYYDIVRQDFAEAITADGRPELRLGSDLFILGDQVYETDLTDNQERILRQRRVLPLELDVATYSDDLLRFSRTLRLRLPQDPSGMSLLRLVERLNIGVLVELSFQPEGNPQNRIEAMSSKIVDVSLSQLRDYTRLLLGKSYELELHETEDGQFLWVENFDLPEFFPGQAGPQVKLQGLFDETLSTENRMVQASLTARRSWPAIALQTYRDKEDEVYVRRYHYYLDEGGMESILTEYLMDHSLEEYPIYSRSEYGYQQVFLEQRTTDPSEIAKQTSLLLGPTTLEVAEVTGLSGKKMHWVETYDFNKVAKDQKVYLAEGDSYRDLRSGRTMPQAGILTLNLTLQSNLFLFLGIGIVGLMIAALLHPGSLLRTSLIKMKQRLVEYKVKKQREIDERPLEWGATFQDHKGRIVKIISVEQVEPERRRRLRFR